VFVTLLHRRADLRTTHASTVDRVTLPCCNLFKLRDGAVAEYRRYIDITPVYV
jgi:limonene-1,2-epoxide hydrolase